jgi:outer membrane protein insertion porin family
MQFQVKQGFVQEEAADLLVVNLFEGERYTVSQVKLAGELLGLDEELQALVDVKPGDTFNAERVKLSESGSPTAVISRPDGSVTAIDP